MPSYPTWNFDTNDCCQRYILEKVRCQFRRWNSRSRTLWTRLGSQNQTIYLSHFIQHQTRNRCWVIGHLRPEPLWSNERVRSIMRICTLTCMASHLHGKSFLVSFAADNLPSIHHQFMLGEKPKAMNRRSQRGNQRHSHQTRNPHPHLFQGIIEKEW